MRALRELLRGLRGDAIYRGSALLLLNSALLAAFGFAFWVIAARIHLAADVGVFSGLTAGIGLLAVIAALGLPNTMLRHLVGSDESRALTTTALAAVAVLGGSVTLVIVVLAGPRLPAELHLGETGSMLTLVIGLAIVSSASTVVDAGLVALRATGVLVTKNLAGSVLKVAVVVPLAPLGARGLVLAYCAGATLACALGGWALLRRLSGGGPGRASPARLRRYASFSAWSYAGTVFATIALSLLPIVVIAVRGAEEAAWFAVAFLIASFLNFIPSTAAQVLFAEVGREPAATRAHVRKAARYVAALLVPAVAVLLLAAPYVLLPFGGDYSDGGAGALRMLALGALLSGGSYLADAVLAARDRMRAYALTNGINALLVVSLVTVLVPRGLTAGATGWVIAQAASLVVALAVLRATGIWSRRPGTRPVTARA